MNTTFLTQQEQETIQYYNLHAEERSYSRLHLTWLVLFVRYEQNFHTP